jgi:hypothetical protein
LRSEPTDQLEINTAAIIRFCETYNDMKITAEMWGSQKRVSCSLFTLRSWWWKHNLAPKRQYTFTRLHDVTSQTTLPLQVYTVRVLAIKG